MELSLLFELLFVSIVHVIFLLRTPLCCQNILFIDIFCAFKEVFIAFFCCYLMMFCNFQTTLNGMVTMYYRQISSPTFATRSLCKQKQCVSARTFVLSLHGKWAHVLVL